MKAGKLASNTSYSPIARRYCFFQSKKATDSFAYAVRNEIDNESLLLFAPEDACVAAFVVASNAVPPSGLCLCDISQVRFPAIQVVPVHGVGGRGLAAQDHCSHGNELVLSIDGAMGCRIHALRLRVFHHVPKIILYEGDGLHVDAGKLAFV